MEKNKQETKSTFSRRSLLGRGMAVGAGAIGAGLLTDGLPTFTAEASGGLTRRLSSLMSHPRCRMGERVEKLVQGSVRVVFDTIELLRLESRHRPESLTQARLTRRSIMANSIDEHREFF